MMKILIVDDDKTTLKLLSLYMKTKGYSVVTAENGMEAIEKITKESDINFILTDLNMPYMDGIEFIKILKTHEEFKKIPVVMITTEADEEEKNKAFQAGADDYLIKPTTADQVSQSIKRILKKFFEKGGEL